MDLVKKWDFFAPFYFGQNRQEKKAFRDILKRKNGFPDYENKE